MNFRTSALFTCMVLLAAPSLAAAVQLVIPPAPLMQKQDRDVEPSRPSDISRLDEREDDQIDERQYHIPLVLNENVEDQISYFTTRGRNLFQVWLDQSARYLATMKRILKEYNLPEDLVYLAMIESGFNMRAESPKNAVGPWQFVRPTGRDYGLNIDQWVDERKDPIKSTHAAAAYLKDLYNTFGSWPLALASYNAGSATVKGAVSRQGTYDLWELIASRRFTNETCLYVPRYMAAMVIAKNPLGYGFLVPGSESFEFDEIVVKKSTSIREIARNAGCAADEILDLNPELIRELTPPTSYIVRIPAGTKDLYESNIFKSSSRDKAREAKINALRNALLLTKLAPDPIEQKFTFTGRYQIVPRFGAQLGSARNIAYFE